MEKQVFFWDQIWVSFSLMFVIPCAPPHQRTDSSVIMAPGIESFLKPLTSRPECMPGSRYTGVGVLFFVI